MYTVHLERSERTHLGGVRTIAHTLRGTNSLPVSSEDDESDIKKMEVKK